MLGFGLLGAIDDWEGIRGPRRGLGMPALTKFILQIFLAIGAAYALKYILKVPELYWPGFWVPFELGNWYIPIAVFIIVGMSNAVNFTDGLDGLAGLIAATAFAAYGAIAIYQEEVFLGRFCFTLVGSSIWISLVQCPSGPIIHGRHRFPLSGSSTGSCRIDDRPMVGSAINCHHSGK